MIDLSSSECPDVEKTTIHSKTYQQHEHEYNIQKYRCCSNKVLATKEYIAKIYNWQERTTKTKTSKTVNKTYNLSLVGLKYFK